MGLFPLFMQCGLDTKLINVFLLTNFEVCVSNIQDFFLAGLKLPFQALVPRLLATVFPRETGMVSDDHRIDF